MPLLDTISVGNSEVKIYSLLHRNRPVVMLDYKWAGERKQRMMRCETPADEKEARRRARELARAMSSGDASLIGFSATEHLTMKAARQALVTVSDISVDAACREYAQAKEILNGRGTILEACEYFIRGQPSSIKPIDTSEAVEEYLKTLEPDGLAVRSVQDYRFRLRRFAEAFKMPLAEITTADLSRWLRGLDVSARSRINYRAVMLSFAHWAQEQGYLRKDVKTEFDALKKVKATTTIHIFTPDQLGTLLDAAETLAQSKNERKRSDGVNCIHYLVLGSFPGIRPQEILRMTGANVRFQHNDIEVLPAQAKGQKHRPGRRRLIPIQPNVRAWLESYPPPENDEKLVLSRAPKFVRDLADKAKVDWQHDIMRHSAISYAVAATGNVDLVALWSGNSRDVIYEHYLNQVTPAEAALYASIMPKHAPKNVIRLPKGA